MGIFGAAAPDLINDLWCRSALARGWHLLPPRVRAIRDPELHAIDQRFRRATVGRPGRDDRAGEWWLGRVPRRLEAETSDRTADGWPMGWDMLSFPRPESVQIID
ncbi:hypothetical protein KQY30_12630 [Streptomyces sp. GMY02]|uniref:hypothetical protein n=1 Tax=Streptomyces sp. GMY02 TaxID=1333528 RepID=UPI001C2C5C33|nr:hypothetical protein [Streptomyces sp. GMY02]QXE34989.1 hypothetical protein KQY30_12630 [Streptomyces sp. GMY02]